MCPNNGLPTLWGLSASMPKYGMAQLHGSPKLSIGDNLQTLNKINQIHIYTNEANSSIVRVSILNVGSSSGNLLILGLQIFKLYEYYKFLNRAFKDTRRPNSFSMLVQQVIGHS